MRNYGWRPNVPGWEAACLLVLRDPRIRLSVSEGNGWPHRAFVPLPLCCRFRCRQLHVDMRLTDSAKRILPAGWKQVLRDSCRDDDSGRVTPAVTWEKREMKTHFAAEYCGSSGKEVRQQILSNPIPRQCNTQSSILVKYRINDTYSVSVDC